MEEKNIVTKIFSSNGPCLSPRQIEAYCKGQLSPQSERAVETHLIDCPLCSDAIDGFMETGCPSPDQLTQQREKVWQKVQRIINQQRPHRKYPIYIKPLWRSAAAAVLVLIIALSFYRIYYIQRPAALFSQYYQPYEIDFPLHYRSHQSTSPPLPSELLQGFQAFDNAQYEESIPLLKQWLVRNPENDIVQFFLGQAYLQTGQTTDAIPLFKKVSQNPHSDYQKAAQWYLALIYIKENQRKKAISLLEQLKETHNSFFSPKAGQLLHQLKQ